MRSPPTGVETPRSDVSSVLHGVDVADPYRWLENGDDPDVVQWVEAQNRLTRAVLDGRPERSVWFERLVALMGLPVVQGVQVRGDLLILLERDAGAQQARLVARPLADPVSAVVVLADPSAHAADSAVAVDWFFAAPDGSLVAYGVSEGGTENSMLRVARTDDGSALVDEIPNCRAASLGWEPDGSGFYYTRYPPDDEYHRTVHHHTLGHDWVDDPVVWADHPTPETWPNVDVSPDGRYVVVDAVVGWSRTDIKVLDRQTGQWRSLIEGVDAITHFEFASDSLLVGTTTLGASRGRVVSLDLTSEQIGHADWTTLVPERDVVVGAVTPTRDGMYVTTNVAGVDSIEHRKLDGTACTAVAGVDLSAVVQVVTDPPTGTALALVTAFDTPTSVWRIDRGFTAVRAHPAESPGSIPDLSVSHLEYPSSDGTMIGIFLVHRADLVPDAGTPTILNGYGGFAITETPMWSPSIAAWCGSGGLYAIAGLRGGFEHGEEWHQAGRRANKQNVFDDFHGAADWLVDTERTSRDRLAIAGGSNGGLLVGVAITQRPDLCRAAWCAVPLLDMVRFPDFLIARLWTDEYGDPAVEEEFGWLFAYSPYHRVAKGQRYPAVLLTTAEGDTRVDPMHARKMAALLQWAAADQHERPVLLDQQGRAGHGVGKPVGKRAAEQADQLAFFSWQLGHRP